MAQRLDALVTCSGCSRKVLEGDLVVWDHGDWYHLQCARPLPPDGRPMEFRGRPRASEVKKMVQNGDPLPKEAAAVRCTVCGAGIARVADMAVRASGPTHVRCRPVS